ISPRRPVPRPAGAPAQSREPPPDCEGRGGTSWRRPREAQLKWLNSLPEVTTTPGRLLIGTNPTPRLSREHSLLAVAGCGNLAPGPHFFGSFSFSFSFRASLARSNRISASDRKDFA